MYLVYKHTSPSGKSYIGITNDYRRRCEQHHYYAWCPAFHSAILKYGWDNFTHEILVEGLIDIEAGLLETSLIVQHNTLFPNGYNLTAGGGNRTHSLESRRKISEGKKGKRGRIPSPEELLKRGATKKSLNIPCLPTTKQAIAAATARRYIITNPGGKVYDIFNLTQFCILHKLHYGGMAVVSTGKRLKYKGWLCVRV